MIKMGKMSDLAKKALGRGVTAGLEKIRIDHTERITGFDFITGKDGDSYPGSNGTELVDLWLEEFEGDRRQRGVERRTGSSAVSQNGNERGQSQLRCWLEEEVAMKRCANCGREFEPNRCTHKYCSRGCNVQAAKARQAAQRKAQLKEIKCAHCGLEFKPTHGHQKYCSRKCRQAEYEHIKNNHRRYYGAHREELIWKHKIYSITGKYPKGKLQ